jgi:hypothetical protein
VAVVIDHEHIAAGFHVPKDLIGRHDKILIEAGMAGEYYLPSSRACLAPSLC